MVASTNSFAIVMGQILTIIATPPPSEGHPSAATLHNVTHTVQMCKDEQICEWMPNESGCHRSSCYGIHRTRVMLSLHVATISVRVRHFDCKVFISYKRVL